MRSAAERLARAGALLLLAWLLVRALRGPGSGPVESVTAATAGAALPRWSTTAPPAGIHLRIDGELSPAARDWLAALRGTGAAVAWENAGVLPLAATAEPVADPAGGTRVLVAAPAGTLLRLGDRYGPLDSVRAAPGAGAVFVARSAPAAIGVAGGAVPARDAVRDSLRLGRILVVGRVSWESKFVISALEERGWSVDARLALAPRGSLSQGGTVRLDTARYSAVLVLDRVGAKALPALAGYVRSGGGAILTAAGVGGLGELGPVRFGPAVPAVEPFDTALPPLRSLGLTPILREPDQLALETRGTQVAVAARRIGRGRVAVLGYQDTWRWRLAGGGHAVEQHGAWWADLVGSVAYVGRAGRPVVAPTDEAPLAHLIEALGPPASGRPAGPIRNAVAPEWLFGALMALLLLEWSSRRLRGAV